MPITHTKVSAKADGADTSLVLPSDWNASHSGSLTHASTTGQTATDHHAAPVAGPDADVTIDSAGAAGTASTFARSAHGHRLLTSATAAVAIGTAAAGTSGHSPSRDDHVHPTGAGTPSTQAMGDAAATGSGPAAAMTDHKHAMPAFATNAILLGSAAAAGAATTPSRSNDTIAAFDTTAPVNQAFADVAAVGVINFAARRDHKHGMPATPALDPHGAAQHTDITRMLFVEAHWAGLDVATSVNIGASANLTKVVAYADAATQGAFWTFMVPADWASG